MRKPTAANPVVFTSEVLRHVNKQTEPNGNASTPFAEAITTPGVSDGSNGGCFIVGAQLSMGLVDKTGSPIQMTTNTRWCTQIQTGNRVTGADILEPDSPFFFASLCTHTVVTTSGALQIAYPIEIPVARPEPIIVMDYFTIVHEGMNDVGHNDEDVFVELFYRTCLIDDAVYNRILRNQSRLS